MMTFRQLLGLWAVISLVVGSLLAVSHPESLDKPHTWGCVALYVLFSFLVIVIVEATFRRLTQYMVGEGHPCPRMKGTPSEQA